MESKKPYEIEIGLISDSTDHRFVHLEIAKRFWQVLVLTNRRELVQNALQAIQEENEGNNDDNQMEIED